MYDKSTAFESVNSLRKDLFPRKVQMMQYLPPTQAALIQHTNRSLYQASIWLKSLCYEEDNPNPDTFGWCKDDKNAWKPLWTTLPGAYQSCRQLVKCGCKAEPKCSRRCTCASTGLQCTALCQCRGTCSRWFRPHILQTTRTVGAHKIELASRIGTPPWCIVICFWSSSVI